VEYCYPCQAGLLAALFIYTAAASLGPRARVRPLLAPLAPLSRPKRQSNFGSQAPLSIPLASVEWLGPAELSRGCKLNFVKARIGSADIEPPRRGRRTGVHLGGRQSAFGLARHLAQSCQIESASKTQPAQVSPARTFGHAKFSRGRRRR